MLRPIMRGDVYWVEIPQLHTKGVEQRTESDTPRPWVVVSAPVVHCRLALIIAVPLTTKDKVEQLKHCRVLVPLDQFIPKENKQIPLKSDMVALAEQVRALSTERLVGDPIAEITLDMMDQIDARLAYALGLPK